MKQPDREWLEQYRTNPRVDMAVYRNYQNPNQWQLPGLREDAMNAGRQQMERADAQTYEQLVAGLPEHMRNLPPNDILDYIRQAHTGQQNLAQERTRFDENIAQRRAQMEQQNQQRLAQQRAANTAPQHGGLSVIDRSRARIARKAALNANQDIEQRAREVNESNARIQAQLQESQRQAQLQAQQRTQQAAAQAANAQRAQQPASEPDYRNQYRQAAWNHYRWARDNADFNRFNMHHWQPADFRNNPMVNSSNYISHLLQNLMRLPSNTRLTPEQFYQFYDSAPRNIRSGLLRPNNLSSDYTGAGIWDYKG